ncbi:MAG TPA: hypothetical protein PLY93_08355 [Turneriella sp.]|nr:hypothetical protein [Turneriella sp.]
MVVLHALFLLRREEIKSYFFIFMIALSFLSCADFERPERNAAPANGVVLIVSSDFSTGFLSALIPTTNTVVKDILPLFNDSTLRYSASEQATFVVQRLGSDSLRRLNNTIEYTTAFERSNPQDIAFLGSGQAAVSFFNRNSIGIVSTQNGNSLGNIDLSSYADADGYAEVGALFYTGGFLYATLGRLNRTATDATWPPVGDSYLLKIDVVSRSVLVETLLTHANPVSRLHYNAARNSLAFAAPARFYFDAALDGACLEYSLTTDTLLTPPITEAQAGLEISDCEIRSDGSGVFIGNNLSRDSVLVLFDSTTHTVTRVAASLSSTNGGYFSNFLLHSNGKLYLADRNIYAPGIRVFSGVGLTEETTHAIYTGLPPFVLEEAP